MSKPVKSLRDPRVRPHRGDVFNLDGAVITVERIDFAGQGVRKWSTVLTKIYCHIFDASEREGSLYRDHRNEFSPMDFERLMTKGHDCEGVGRARGDPVKITYDPSCDAAYIYLCEIEPGAAVTTVDVHDDMTVMLDYDAEGRLLGVEVMGAYERLRIETLAQAEVLKPSPGECTCDCHKPGQNILHVMACCEPCNDCGEPHVAVQKLHDAECPGPRDRRARRGKRRWPKGDSRG